MNLFDFESSVKRLKEPNYDHASRPCFIAESMRLTLSSNSRNAVVVASSTRIDPPPADLCRRGCRVISGMIATDNTQRPCHDTRRDADMSSVMPSFCSHASCVLILIIGNARPHVFENM